MKSPWWFSLGRPMISVKTQLELIKSIQRKDDLHGRRCNGWLPWAQGRPLRSAGAFEKHEVPVILKGYKIFGGDAGKIKQLLRMSNEFDSTRLLLPIPEEDTQGSPPKRQKTSYPARAISPENDPTESNNWKLAAFMAFEPRDLALHELILKGGEE